MSPRQIGWKRLAPSLLLLVLFACQAKAESKPLEFHLTFDKSVSAKPFTGRVYVMLTKGRRTDLPRGPSWMQPEPFFAIDAKDWKPGDELV